MQLREYVMMHSFTILIHIQITFGYLRSRDGAVFEAWRDVSAHWLKIAFHLTLWRFFLKHDLQPSATDRLIHKGLVVLSQLPVLLSQPSETLHQHLFKCGKFVVASEAGNNQSSQIAVPNTDWKVQYGVYLFRSNWHRNLPRNRQTQIRSKTHRHSHKRIETDCEQIDTHTWPWLGKGRRWLDMACHRAWYQFASFCQLQLVRLQPWKAHTAWI